jgi:hypothetical protein
MLCSDLLHNDIMRMEVLMLIISMRGQGEVPDHACPRSTIAEIGDKRRVRASTLGPFRTMNYW